jgi:glycerate 2-kinase
MSTRSSLLREHAGRIVEAGLDAAAPGPAVRRTLGLDRDHLVLAGDPAQTFDLRRYRVVVVGAGKAATAMGAAVEALLGDRLRRGLLVTKDGHGRSLQRITLTEASHPVPDVRSVEAARRAGRLLDGCGDDTLVLALISGGASALSSLPAEGLSLADKATTNALLLRSGADISACNTVRKHLSAIKGGLAARRAGPATVAALLLSDVIGDPPAVIGSGPFSPDPTTYADALGVLASQGLTEAVPARVRMHLEAGARGDVEETPKPGDPAFSRVHTRIIASNAESLLACRRAAEALGYAVHDLGGALDCDATEVAAIHADLAAQIRAGAGPVRAPACILSGGEPTVRVVEGGRGGRNQHVALAAVPRLAGLGDVLLVSAGTDGTDGPTDAAGAWVDGTSSRRAAGAGLDPATSLAACDAYPFFETLGDLLITGPTGTNVMDLHITLIG